MAGADPRAIVGICSDHVRRFFAEVEAALEGQSRSASDASATATRIRRRTPDGVTGRVSEALANNAGMDLCDRCLAREAQCSTAEAEAAAVTLAASEDFLRDAWRCGRCGTRAQVTRARHAGLSPSAA